MTKSELHVLRAVFGYRYGPVSVKGHNLPLHHSQTRLMKAAKSFEREGLVNIHPHQTQSGIFVVSAATNSPL